ncbi:phage tail tape measure protein [Parvibaculum sp.]|uniref:phage tail tape measure protein n=1 Tax=Parvibaculum sp. TaxID=2024848 RepID=UPI00271D2C60|nr:phage tail tape measure protein [Parvibaculum sp.]MDO9126952.1 phage tail tape measure protein [Parvibaculum sp.]MDP1627510.1 phage tail tape measure protein [Parvibaculum sp.]MDP2148689.1 phage tail tape measure protein [Parvibaculum sp.]MDP3326715.1 phage tail tape measure protein [Parvibaculum sp.]
MTEDNDPEALTLAMEAAAEATRAFGLETQRTMKAVTDDFRRAGAGGRDFGSAVAGAFDGIALKGRSLSDVLRKLALDLSRMALESAGNAMGSAISGAMGNLFASAKGNAFSDGRVMPFAKGGVVSSPMLFPLRGGTGLAGEAGAEAILPLRRGADGRLGVAAEGGAAPMQITFNVTAADAESFRRSESQIAAMLARVAGRGARNL